MGQYWRAITIRPDQEIKRYDPSENGEGLKLMEHSYVGNPFTEAVMKTLTNSPAHVAWIGDYADEVRGDAWEDRLEPIVLQCFIDDAWDYENPTVKLYTCDPVFKEYTTSGYKNLYLVNHTKKQYIDLERYFETSLEPYRYRNIETGKFQIAVECIHPLPLLTACGNGRGGGDYARRFPNSELVGTWAFDLLELKTTIDDLFPYKEICPKFKEKEE